MIERPLRDALSLGSRGDVREPEVNPEMRHPLIGTIQRYKIHCLEMLGVMCLLATPPAAPSTRRMLGIRSGAETSGQPPAARSPWLLLPTFSSNPKLGNVVGGMGAYVTKFDPKSQVSIFGLSAQYTDTDSATAAAIARTSFRDDHHRISMVAVGGRIKNDYDDSLVPGCRSSRKTTSALCWADISIGSKGIGSSADSCCHELPHLRSDSPR